MAVRDNPSVLRFYYPDNDADAALLGAHAFGKNLTKLNVRRENKRALHRLIASTTWDDAKAWVARLNYRGITGWRLPTALNEDGSGPCVGDNCGERELGHLVFTALERKSPGLRLVNWQPFSIYWSSTEASATEAFAFKMTGLKQGLLAKNPWAVDPALGAAVVMADVVLTWPVHDGDVAAGFFRRLIESIFYPVRWSFRVFYASHLPRECSFSICSRACRISA